MIAPIRFLFDECAIGKGTVERELKDSLALFGAEAELAHLLSKFPAGTLDTDWIPQIANEGGWVIVSSDRGAKSKKSEKLPLICREQKVTHVLLSRAIHKRPTSGKVLAISSCWEKLIEAAAAAPGSGFLITLRVSKSGIDQFDFKQTYDPEPPKPAEPGPAGAL